MKKITILAVFSVASLFSVAAIAADATPANHYAYYHSVSQIKFHVPAKADHAFVQYMQAVEHLTSTVSSYSTLHQRQQIMMPLFTSYDMLGTVMQNMQAHPHGMPTSVFSHYSLATIHKIRRFDDSSDKAVMLAEKTGKNPILQAELQLNVSVAHLSNVLSGINHQRLHNA